MKSSLPPPSSQQTAPSPPSLGESTPALAEALAEAFGGDLIAFAKGLLLARVKDLEEQDQKMENLCNQVINLISLHDEYQIDQLAGERLRGKMVSIVNASNNIQDDLQEELQETLDFAAQTVPRTAPTAYDWPLQRYLNCVCVTLLEIMRKNEV